MFVCAADEFHTMTYQVIGWGIEHVLLNGRVDHEADALVPAQGRVVEDPVEIKDGREPAPRT
jgi:hypothetical protein